LGGDLEDGGRSISPSSQPQAPIKQELDHHMTDFHDNISLPVSNAFLSNLNIHTYYIII
jgi:hypothetical protein